MASPECEPVLIGRKIWSTYLSTEAHKRGRLTWLVHVPNGMEPTSNSKNMKNVANLFDEHKSWAMLEGAG